MESFNAEQIPKPVLSIAPFMKDLGEQLSRIVSTKIGSSGLCRGKYLFILKAFFPQFWQGKSREQNSQKRLQNSTNEFFLESCCFLQKKYVRMAPTLFSAPLNFCIFRRVIFREKKKLHQEHFKESIFKTILFSKNLMA